MFVWLLSLNIDVSHPKTAKKEKRQRKIQMKKVQRASVDSIFIYKVCHRDEKHLIATAMKPHPH